MYKSLIFFIHFISLVCFTQQLPASSRSNSDRSNYILCPKGGKRCGTQCYNPKKYVCLSPEENDSNTVTTRLPSVEQTTEGIVTKPSSVSQMASSSTSTIAPKTSPAVVKTTTPKSNNVSSAVSPKSNNTRMCRMKKGTKDRKECLCGTGNLYNPQTYKCRDGKLICKKGNKNCRDTSNNKPKAGNAREKATEIGIEFGAKVADELLDQVVPAIEKFISGINEVSQDRADFTSKTVDHFKELFNGKKSVLVIDNKWTHMISVGDTYVKTHVEVPRDVSGTHGFDIYVFDEGLVTKHGDGGSINWGYYGNTEKIDGDATRIRFNKLE